MPQRMKSDGRRHLPAIKVEQWLAEWEKVRFDPRQHRAKPPDGFYLFSLAAADLRALSGISRRSTEGGVARALDLGIQRRHDPERSEEIREYVKSGFPWSSLSRQRRESGEYDDLKKPGWLPTAIVVNVLKGDDVRHGQSVHTDDLIELIESKDGARLRLPKGFGESWQPTGTSPIEVIDGQHRLWAFSQRRSAQGYSLPVVAFFGLDISWQAYLFYTINIKPKRINASLAFDLYPLLRTEDWLERFEGHSIYRETRAQEITEAMWSYPGSAWHERIDMLGGRKGVTQASWIRALQATFVKAFESNRATVGGLFGAPRGQDELVLEWSRAEQSAFIVLIWQAMQSAVKASKDAWAQDLRAKAKADSLDAAFAGEHTLLNNDQGVRGVLSVFNDLCWMMSEHLKLDDLAGTVKGEGTAESAISEALARMRKSAVGKFVGVVAKDLAAYDWRTSGASGLSENTRSAKARFRGGTGYRELRVDLLRHLAAYKDQAGKTAELAIEALKLDE
jgi:DNA-sulfur modification-associated